MAEHEDKWPSSMKLISALLVPIIGWMLLMQSGLTALQGHANSTDKQVEADREQYQQDIREIRRSLQEIDQRTARIEGKLDNKR